MCLIAFAWGLRPDCPLLLASNRDEFWDRPTLPLSTWTLPGGMAVSSGRDERAGGTWLGFNAAGRVAMLTNVRSGDAEAVAPRSRGELVTHWLAGPVDCPHASALTSALYADDYGGFNLVLGDVHRGDWVWLTNRVEHTGSVAHATSFQRGWCGAALSPGVYGVSNAGLDTPWPKTRRLKAATALALERLGPLPDQDNEWRQPLLDTLMDCRLAPVAELPKTGVPPEREWALSSPFVLMPGQGYGTRSSLLARYSLGSAGARLELEEWTHAPPPSHGRDNGPLDRWPLESSTYRRISMSM
jgi:uncharacterized protein with NRDE domain